MKHTYEVALVTAATLIHSGTQEESASTFALLNLVEFQLLLGWPSVRIRSESKQLTNVEIVPRVQLHT